MAMLAQRIMGIMTHWREYMLMRGKLLRPSHIYTGETEGGVLPGIYVKVSLRPLRAPSPTKPAADLPIFFVLPSRSQSCGSSGTVALASALAADVITSAERGPYMNITSLGILLAPSIGHLLLLAALSILSYAMLMSLAMPIFSHALVLIFATSFSITVAYIILIILTVDLYYATPATATAANTLHPVDPPRRPSPNNKKPLPILSTIHLPQHQTYTILFPDLDVSTTTPQQPSSSTGTSPT
ncbi:hypothetical protein AnigIFM56816_007906 [Aspergillus niger]|nr:hypothetical protein AnigIFM56816_007906 [Aspergillus niger]